MLRRQEEELFDDFYRAGRLFCAAGHEFAAAAGALAAASQRPSSRAALQRLAARVCRQVQALHEVLKR